MPDWVTGNQVYISSNEHFHIQAGQDDERHGLLLTDEAVGLGAENFMAQPGVLRGLNVFAGANSSSQDLDVLFRKRVYNGVAGYGAIVDFTLFTIPAGETGHFCAPKITTELSDRSWARWDRVGMTQKRAGDNGAVTNWTIAVCLEITEETLTDTQAPPNRPIEG